MLNQKTSLLLFLSLGIFLLAGCTPVPTLTSGDNVLVPSTESATPYAKPVNHSTPSPEWTISPNQSVIATEDRFRPIVPIVTDFYSSTNSKGAIMLMTDLGSDLFLQETNSGKIRPLFQQQFQGHFIKWINGGCYLMVTEEGKGDILLVDLSGSVVQKVFNYQDLEKRGIKPYTRHVFLSPDNLWFWFWTGNGRAYDEMGPDSRLENQNIQTISTDLKQGPFDISIMGGGWVASWSPNGERIAFTDYDEHHVPQVHLASKDGKNRTQVTHFSQPSTIDNPGTNIQNIIWSPDGNEVSVNYSTITNNVEDFATTVINIIEDRIVFTLPDAILLWWINPQYAVIQLREGKAAGLAVYDIESDNIIGRIYKSDFPQMQMVNSFVSPNLIGFYGRRKANEFYVYDFEKSVITYEPIIKMILDQTWWNTSPGNVLGENSCKN